VKPPRYIGPRRLDRPRKRRNAAQKSGRNVTSDRVRSPSDDELDAAFLAAMAQDGEDKP
jgi:hypothetical protein